MGESKFGEPWGVYMGTIGGQDRPFIQGSDAEGEFDKIVCGVDSASSPPLPLGEIERRMKRASACVNACAGIDDPIGYLAEVERLVEAAREHRCTDHIALTEGNGQYCELCAALSALEEKRWPRERGSRCVG